MSNTLAMSAKFLDGGKPVYDPFDDKYFERKAYQAPVSKALYNSLIEREIGTGQDLHTIALCAHRRWGKDYLALKYALALVLKYWSTKKITVYIIGPTYAQVKKIYFKSSDIEKGGGTLVDQAIPLDFLKKKEKGINMSELTLRFKNDSIIQFAGSERYDTLRGTQYAFCIITEYQECNPDVLVAAGSVLSQTGGVLLVMGTPTGHNHWYDFFHGKDASEFGEFVQFYHPNSLTGVFNERQCEIQRNLYIRAYGEEMGNSVFEQEINCSWDVAVKGSVFSKELRRATAENRIGSFPYDPNFEVFTAWDPGKRDANAIWWFQAIQGYIRLIDYHEDVGYNVEHYADLVMDRTCPVSGHKYRYGGHFLPWDGAIESYISRNPGDTAERMLREKGLEKVTVLKQKSSITSRAQLCRREFHRFHFNSDSKGVETGLVALHHFRYKEGLREDAGLSKTPLHDKYSHCGDALGYALVAIYEGLVKAGGIHTRIQMSMDRQAPLSGLILNTRRRRSPVYA